MARKGRYRGQSTLLRFRSGITKVSLLTLINKRTRRTVLHYSAIHYKRSPAGAVFQVGQAFDSLERDVEKDSLICARLTADFFFIYT